jgi:DUF3037 family protein
MTRYSIIQYVPDPITDERINIGVLVLDDQGDVSARFLKQWRRVESFGGADTRFLRDFAREVAALAGAQQRLIKSGGISKEVLEQAAGKWLNTIQLTPLRASTLDADSLLDEIAQRFLRERVTQRRVRDRRAAASIAASHLTTALGELGALSPEHYVHRNYAIQGGHEQHSLDVALANGSARLGVLGLSFESGIASQLRREIAATAWTVDDVRSAAPDLPVTVVALPPRSGGSKTFDHAVELFESLEARVVREDEVSEWAPEAVHEADVLHEAAV